MTDAQTAAARHLNKWSWLNKICDETTVVIPAKSEPQLLCSIQLVRFYHSVITTFSRVNYFQTHTYCFYIPIILIVYIILYAYE